MFKFRISLSSLNEGSNSHDREHFLQFVIYWVVSVYVRENHDEILNYLALCQAEKNDV